MFPDPSMHLYPSLEQEILQMLLGPGQTPQNFPQTHGKINKNSIQYPVFPSFFLLEKCVRKTLSNSRAFR